MARGQIIQVYCVKNLGVFSALNVMETMGATGALFEENNVILYLLVKNKKWEEAILT